jgi:hypothetical protein
MLTAAKFSPERMRQSSQREKIQEVQEPHMTELRRLNLAPEEIPGQEKRRDAGGGNRPEVVEIDFDRIAKMSPSEVTKLSEREISAFLARFFASIDYNLEELNENQDMLEKFFILDNIIINKKTIDDANTLKRQQQKILEEVLSEIEKAEEELANQILYQPGKANTIAKKDFLRKNKMRVCAAQLEIWRADHILKMEKRNTAGIAAA